MAEPQFEIIALHDLQSVSGGQDPVEQRGITLGEARVASAEKTRTRSYGKGSVQTIEPSWGEWFRSFIPDFGLELLYGNGNKEETVNSGSSDDQLRGVTKHRF
jgi:hypothetical protein